MKLITNPLLNRVIAHIVQLTSTASIQILLKIVILDPTVQGGIRRRHVSQEDSEFLLLKVLKQLLVVTVQQGKLVKILELLQIIRIVKLDFTVELAQSVPTLKIQLMEEEDVQLGKLAQKDLQR